MDRLRARWLRGIGGLIGLVAPLFPNHAYGGLGPMSTFLCAFAAGVGAGYLLSGATRPGEPPDPQPAPTGAMACVFIGAAAGLALTLTGPCRPFDVPFTWPPDPYRGLSAFLLLPGAAAFAGYGLAHLAEIRREPSREERAGRAEQALICLAVAAGLCGPPLAAFARGPGRRVSRPTWPVAGPLFWAVVHFLATAVFAAMALARLPREAGAARHRGTKAADTLCGAATGLALGVPLYIGVFGVVDSVRQDGPALHVELYVPVCLALGVVTAIVYRVAQRRRQSPNDN
jgi:hypothetical protein